MVLLSSSKLCYDEADVQERDSRWVEKKKTQIKERKSISRGNIKESQAQTIICAVENGRRPKYEVLTNAIIC